MMVDPNDEATEPRLLFMIDHSVRESAEPHPVVVSRRLQFVTINPQEQASNAGWAPHLDLVPFEDTGSAGILPALIEEILQSSWINKNLEPLVLAHASQFLAPEHYQEVKTRRERQADKIMSAVNERLVKEINYWSDRYLKLSDDVAAGKQPRLQPDNARNRVEELTARLEQRKKELEAMKNVVSSTPLVIGGALVIPQGLLESRSRQDAGAPSAGNPNSGNAGILPANSGNAGILPANSGNAGILPAFVDSQARARIEHLAMKTVMEAEQALGHQVKAVSAEKCGWDITS
ncbi:MAG: hypothetical protein HQM12_24130 [SAR324 cluster bacterium]|nr:hypothetical protein [SAR324 cluster bacterium]